MCVCVRVPRRASVNLAGSPVRATAAELRRSAEDSPAPSPTTATMFTFAHMSMSPLPCTPAPTPIAIPEHPAHSPITAAPSPPAPPAVIVSEDLNLALPPGVTAPRREKSLGALCQRFVAIFLLGRSWFCLDDAARVLMSPVCGCVPECVCVCVRVCV